MSLRNKLAAGVFAVSAFTVAGFAQEAKPEAKQVTKDGEAKIERRADRAKGHEIRGGLFGRQMGGRALHGILGIDLSDEQKAQVRQILEANRPDPAVMREAKTILRAKFEGTATADQEARLQVLKTQAISQARDVKAKLEAVITAEQKAQIEQRKQEMKTKMKDMHDRFQVRKQQRQTEKSKVTPKEVTKDN